MNSRSDIIGDLSNLLKVTGFMAIFLLMTGLVRAQSSMKATGEIVSASQATINGLSAISGMTIFSNNRISTGKQGAAIINLGRLGRIEFGAETDMTLRLSGASIGGELHSNRVVVSARAGIAIGINTAKGMVITDGQQPAVLTIYIDSKHARVIAHVGSASVISASKEGRQKEDRMAEGEELSQSPSGQGWRRASMTAGSIVAIGALRSAPRAGQVARPVTATATTATSNASTFTGLFKAGVNHSIAPKPSDSDAEGAFETSMTCRDGDKKQKPCRKKSRFKPNRP